MGLWVLGVGGGRWDEVRGGCWNGVEFLWRNWVWSAMLFLLVREYGIESRKSVKDLFS